MKTGDSFHTPRGHSRRARQSPSCRRLWSAGHGPTSPAERVRKTTVRRDNGTTGQQDVDLKSEILMSYCGPRVLEQEAAGPVPLTQQQRQTMTVFFRL